MNQEQQTITFVTYAGFYLVENGIVDHGQDDTKVGKSARQKKKKKRIDQPLIGICFV